MAFSKDHRDAGKQKLLCRLSLDLCFSKDLDENWYTFESF